MPRKQKPRKNWADGGSYDFPYLSDDDFKQIATALGVATIDEEFRSKIQKAVRHYFADKDYMPSIPKPPEVRAALQSLRSRTKALMDCLEALDAYSLEVLASTSVFPGKAIYNLVDGQSDCYKIHSAASEALEKFKVSIRGRQIEKGALRNFIVRLKVIFEDIKQLKATITWHEYKGIYQGAFYDFVQGCLEIIDPGEIWSNSSLGKQIKITLKSSKTKKSI